MSSSNDRLGIMIVDDHALFRKGLKDVIVEEEDMELLAEAIDGKQAVELALKVRPDIILMDVNLPGSDGIEATRAITGRLEATKVVMLTVSSLDEHLFEAIKAGAIGYLTKNVSPEGLIRTIRGVRDGEAPLSRSMTAKILEHFQSGEPQVKIPEPENSLTDREAEILELLVEGAKDKEIAECLCISLHTVKKHVQNILRKLHVKNRAAAAAAAAIMANRKED